MAISIVVAHGFICRHSRRSGFKLAVVVGYSGNNMRVRFWRAASKKWTLPTVVDANDLDHLSAEDHRKHERTIKEASACAPVKVWS